MEVFGSLQGQQEASRTYVFSRFDFAGLVADVYGVDSCQRFDRVKGNYEQYAVNGFKFEFIPTTTVGVIPQAGYDPNGTILYAWTFEDVDTYNIANYVNE